MKVLLLYLFTLLSIVPQKSQHLGSWRDWLSFSFHLPSLPRFWVNSCFSFDVLWIQWIIFSVRDVINCLWWIWMSTLRHVAAQVMFKGWCDTCFIVNALLHFLVCLLLPMITFCFVFIFFYFLTHCSPVTFILAGLLNSTAILSTRPFFVLFPCPIRPLNLR